MPDTNVLDSVGESLKNQPIEGEESNEEEIKEESNDSLETKEKGEKEETFEENNKEQSEDKPEEVPEEDERAKKIRNLNLALSKERAKKRELKEKTPEEVAKEEQKETDLSKITEEIKEGILEEQYKANEKIAIEEFCNEHTELLDDRNWYKMMTSYKESYGKTSKESIMKNLEGAYSVFSQNNSVDKAKEDGRKEAISDFAKSNIANIPSGGNTTHGKDSPVLTKEQQEIIKKTGMSPKEYKELADSETYELPIHDEIKQF